MNIGVDIDGVLTDFERYVIDYGMKTCVEKNWPINIDVSQYLDINTFDWDKHQAEIFRDKYFIKYLTETPVREFAPDIVEKLKEEGNKIYLITARDDDEMPKEYYGKMQDLTIEWLKNKNIKYDKIIFKKEKLQPCIDNDIDVMIEDSPQNIEKLSKKIKVIKFDCQYNKHVKNENVMTAYSWYHIYNIINEVQKNPRLQCKREWICLAKNYCHAHHGEDCCHDSCNHCKSHKNTMPETNETFFSVKKHN